MNVKLAVADQMLLDRSDAAAYLLIFPLTFGAGPSRPHAHRVYTTVCNLSAGLQTSQNTVRALILALAEPRDEPSQGEKEKHSRSVISFACLCMCSYSSQNKYFSFNLHQIHDKEYGPNFVFSFILSKISPRVLFLLLAFLLVFERI
jgi:hypothetical protein